MVNIKVAVRIRPFSQRELSQKDESIVQTSDKSILITNIKVPERQDGDSRQRVRRFAVDYCYDPKYPDTCSQESVYRDIGKEVLDSMFDGYNACVLAYGHSASGKTYTMMGNDDDPGLTPRICQGLFQRMDERALEESMQFHTMISFLEIYNERVRDLLVNDDSTSNFSLRVREHPKLGPYVQDLSQHVVSDEDRILEYLAVGNSRRSTAATENNVHSSRSHAVFTIKFQQSDDNKFDTEVSSKVHLVDLAGSERAGSTQSKTRLKEGANINKSLVTLGNVISALAESCETYINSRDQTVTKTWQPFVPYRDSVLTWLLKDTLGGNSNTIMIATISPASSCLNETINTLRYAKRTKRIVNQPIINEDPKIRTIRELREEISKLQNVILTLQIDHRKYQESELSISRSVGDDSFGEIVLKDSSSNLDQDEVGGKDEGEELKQEGIRILDILPGGVEKNESELANICTGKKNASANSFSNDVSKINDENKPDVNGSVIDKLVHESQVFSDSLESFSVLRAKTTNRCGFERGEIDGETCNLVGRDSESNKTGPCKNYRENQSRAKSKLKACSKAKHRFRLCLKRECNSLERARKKTSTKMLHRSRPDLIKGIASHSKDGLPSASSQSFTDVSGLSQSASENSLNSSGSVESESKSVKCWPDKSHSPMSEAMQRKPTSRHSSIGDGSGSSTPTQIPKPIARRRSDKRSEIVAAVTTRLYATKKKPDPRMEALQAAEKDDYDDGELEELKLCKRARMKLFDLSRKLAMAKKIKRTMDNDTQTDFQSSTVRMKEKSILTDQSGVLQYETSGTNTPLDRNLKKDQPIIMNQVFIPRSSNYVVECGKNLRVEVPKPVKFDSCTQTVFITKDQTTSPVDLSANEESFSDDSLDDAKIRKDVEFDSLETSKPVKSQSNENIFKNSVADPIIKRRSYDSLMDIRKNDRSWLPITRYPISGTNALYEYDPNNSELEAKAKNPEEKTRKAEIVLPLFNGLPLAVCVESASSGENLADDTGNFMNRFLEDNASSENSFVSNDGSDVTTSSETSSEDFVFYEPAQREKETGNRLCGLGDLYTISENSEHSDLTASDPSSPQPSQHSSLQVLDQPETQKCVGAKEEAISPKYTVGVHVLRNPRASKEELKKDEKEGERCDSSETLSQPHDRNPQKKAEKSKRIHWSDIPNTSQRQFLNFNILGSSRQTPFSIDSNLFEKKHASEGNFPSEDSITFVFMAPNRQKTSVLMEIIKRTLGQGSSSENVEKSRKSKNRGVQCKLMRSISVDTAMLALSRFAKHQRPTLDIPRTSSLDTIVPEEMQTILDQGRLHGESESGCQCDSAKVCQCRKPKYTISTSTTRDQGTETDVTKTDKSCMTTCLVDASCDALPVSQESLFEEYYPELPRKRIQDGSVSSRWKEMKELILGATAEEKADRKSSKSVSWSDLSDCEEGVETQKESETQTRRVRFSEPDDLDTKDTTQTAASVTAFLQEAVQLLRNLNHMSQIFEGGKRIDPDLGVSGPLSEDDSWHEKNPRKNGKSSLRKVETEVQTDGRITSPSGSFSAECSPIRRARTSSSLAERRKASINLTWPRQRPTNLFSKPPSGLKQRPPLPFRTHSTSIPSFDLLKNDVESSSTSTNWNISNLSTTLSNSYYDSGCSRPSSAKSFYSDKFSDPKPWTRSKTSSPRGNLPRLNTELEMELEESCRRLELAVERDKLREENSLLRLSSVQTRKYNPPKWYNSQDYNFRSENETQKKIESYRSLDSRIDHSPGSVGPDVASTSINRKTRIKHGDAKAGSCIRCKPCKCYCHYKNTSRVYRSSLELEATTPIDRHCHSCCTPCDALEPERSISTPALNSVCEDNKCRLFYYGYCPCSPVKLPHVKSSPRAYMQHLLNLRRQIVNKTRLHSVNNT